MRHVAVLCALTSLSAAGACGAQSVVNGDFSLAVPRNGTGNGWTSSQIDGAGGWLPTGGNPDGCFILNDGGSSLTDPTLSQLISGLVVGHQYRVTGDYASWHINGSPPGGMSFRVRMDGAQVFLGATTPGRTWTPFSSAPFVATATSMLLELQAEVDGTDNDFAVDNIAIVPAPAALLTLAGLAAARRRRGGR